MVKDYGIVNTQCNELLDTVNMNPQDVVNLFVVCGISKYWVSCV